MSQHPSLREDSVGGKHRNVFTRLERIKKLQDQKKWSTNGSVFGLPKVKSMKIKVKKAAAKAEGAKTAEGAVKAPEGAPKPAAKPAAGASAAQQKK